jgi:hypothetical protein
MSTRAQRLVRYLKSTPTVLGCLLAVVACGSMPPSAAQSIEGSWVVEEAEREMAPHEQFLGASVVFNADNSFSIQRIQRTPWRGTYSIDVDSGTIDLTFRGRNLTPPSDGTVWEGIFRFLADGALEINTATGYDARPVEFLTGYDLTMLTLRRAD